MVLRPRQHSIGYMEDGFYRSKRPNQQYQSTEGKTLQRKTQKKQKNTKYTYTYKIVHDKEIHIYM